mgnify:CR=1 FL=1
MILFCYLIVLIISHYSKITCILSMMSHLQKLKNSKKIMDIVNDDDDIELDDMENPGEYLHKQDNKIPPIDYKGFYGIDPPF